MPRLVKIVSSIALLFALVACDIYQEKIAPEFALPDVQTTLSETADQAEALPQKWWEFFEEPELNQLVEAGLKNNFDLNMALIRKEAAQFELTRVKSRYYPSVSVSPSIGVSYTVANDFSDSYGLPLSISYEADIWKKVAKSVEIGEIAIALTEQDIRAAKISLSSDIVTLYFDLQLVRSLQAITEKKEKLQAMLLELVKARKSYGFAEKTAVIQLEQSLKQTQIQKIQEKETLQSLQNSLSFLLARPYRYEEGEATDVTRHWNNPLPLPAEIPSRVIYQRPDIASSFLALQRQQKEVYLSKVELLPSLSISTSFRFASSMLKDLFNSDFFSMGAGAGVQHTLFDGGSRDASVDLAETRYKMGLLDHKRQLFNALKEVEGALIEQDSLLRQFEEKKQMAQQTLETLELVMQEKELGSRSKLDEITQKVSLLGTISDLLNTKNRIRESRISLLKALGGGFEEIPSYPRSKSAGSLL